MISGYKITQIHHQDRIRDYLFETCKQNFFKHCNLPYYMQDELIYIIQNVRGLL